MRGTAVGLQATKEVTPKERESSPLSRVRSHIHMALGQQGSSLSDWPLVHDLRVLVNRLAKARERGIAVELSPQLSNANKALRIVGNELLVLRPDQEGVR